MQRTTRLCDFASCDREAYDTLRLKYVEVDICAICGTSRAASELVRLASEKNRLSQAHRQQQLAGCFGGRK